MFDKLIQRLVGYVAAQVAEEIVKNLPGIIEQVIDQAVKALPDAYEEIAEQVISRLTSKLPFPFKF